MGQWNVAFPVMFPQHQEFRKKKKIIPYNKQLLKINCNQNTAVIANFCSHIFVLDCNF
jgi:hypothetical protein